MVTGKGWSALACSVLLAITLTACAHAALPNRDNMTDAVARLEQVFPTIEGLKVSGWRDQDWCRFIEYPHGSFSNLLEGETSTCNLFDGPPQAFDTQASTDFARVEQAFKGANLSVWMAWGITYDDRDKVNFAEFDMNAGLTDRWMYLYSPNQPISKDDWPDAEAFQQVNEHWWFVDDDWM